VIAFAGLVLLLIFLDDDDEEIFGKVTNDGKGVAGVKIAYTENGVRKTTSTDNNGDYSIEVSKDSDVVMVEVSKDDLAATELPSLRVVKDRTMINFVMSKK